MVSFTELRLLATLRRISKALERANELELHRQELDFPPLRSGPEPPKRVVISKPTVGEWNEKKQR